MVKKRGVVWNYYDKKINGSQIVASCKFCCTSYNQNATRMERHIQRCPKCPEDIRQQFIQLAYNKRHKTNVLDKVNNDWQKQESSTEHIVTDTELEDLDNWNYRNRSYSNKTPSTIQQNINLTQNDDQSSASHGAAIQNNESNANPTNRNWDANQNSTEPVTIADSPKQTSSVHRRKSCSPRKVVRWPFLSMASYLPLQNRIFQEQLLEKRALRKAAQLELRRKTLELKRLRWEYERDKVQSEIRWAHETRMMHLKEEREKQLIGQKKT